ncbi:MAG: type II toxin-antitoxin system prevent-host-death family antitoxin [Elusimicrobiota bacterium]
MIVRTSSSRLKAKLGQFMKAVRKGQEVVVTDRDEPVARLIPYGRQSAQKEPHVAKSRDPGAPPLGELEVKAIEYRGKNTTTILAEERRGR